MSSITLSSSNKSLTTDYSGWSLSGIDVTAHYTDGSTTDVSGSSSWYKQSGVGTFNTSNLFYTITSAGTAIIRSAYTKDGITKYADFSFTIADAKVLSSISLDPTSKTVTTNSAPWSLNFIDVTAHYDDGSSSTIGNGYTWTYISGPGTYTSSSNTVSFEGVSGNVILRCSYFRNGITKTANFTFNVQ